MNKEEITNKIESLDKEKKKLQHELFEIENEDRINNFKNNVGKYFVKVALGMGESAMMFIKKIQSEEDFIYSVDKIERQMFLNGLDLISFTSSTPFPEYRLNTYKETTKEEYESLKEEIIKAIKE